MFSLTPNKKVPPDVPKPAPAEISPVGFSSTSILMILELGFSPSTTLEETDLKKFKLLRLFSLLFCKISLNGSPSSISKLFLITLSLVILFPKIFIFSTNIFSVSFIIKFKFNLLSIIFSSTFAFIDLYSSFKVILSKLSKILSTVLIE